MKAADRAAPGVHVTGLVPPGSSGVADYGRLLAEALRAGGHDVTLTWIVNDGSSWTGSFRAANRLLGAAGRVPPGATVLWQYSSFAYGLRGIPLHGSLFGLAVRLRGGCRRVVTVLHEPAYPRGRRGWRGAVQWATQGCALRPVLLGSHHLVVTTPPRAADTQAVSRPFRRPVHVVPVFSTLGEPAAAPPVRQAGPFVLGVLKYTGDGNRPDVVLGALGRMDPATRPELVLLGAPGPGALEARPWIDAARAAEVPVGWSGVVDPEGLRDRILACDLVLLPNDQGPSGRWTTLASALALGVPVVTLDGPETWDELQGEGAVAVVAADPAALAAALVELLGSQERRAMLQARGRAFYARWMSLDRAAQAFTGLVGGGQIPRTFPVR